MHRHILEIETRGRGLYDITARVNDAVKDSSIDAGLCHCFIHHTSASLVITENADPQVHRDLETFLSRLVPDGHDMFGHTDEGPDDMPSHVRNVLTATELNAPVEGGRLDLGRWQGLYVYEHRHAPHRRRITVTVSGG